MAQTDRGCPFHTGSHNNNENQVLLKGKAGTSEGIERPQKAEDDYCPGA